MQNKIKHLEIIQTVINRMSTNSFLIKGWSVTLVSALIALSSKDADKRYYVISYFPVLIFWLLDGFFLSQERRYRALYDNVRLLPNNKINFSMNTKQYDKRGNTWLWSCFSRVLLIFYSVLILVVVTVSKFISE